MPTKTTMRGERWRWGEQKGEIPKREEREGEREGSILQRMVCKMGEVYTGQQWKYGRRERRFGRDTRREAVVKLAPSSSRASRKKKKKIGDYVDTNTARV